MSNTVYMINYAIAISGLVISILCLIFSIFLRNISKWFRYFFTTLFAVLFIYISSVLICHLSLGQARPSHALISRITMYLYSITSSLMIPMLTTLLLKYCGVNWRKSKAMYLVIGIWTVYLIILTSTWFDDSIYYITDKNVYHRGPLFPLLSAPSIILMTVTFIMVLHNRKRLTRKQTIVFMLYVLFPLVAMILQTFFYGILFIPFGASLAVLIMYISLYIDQVHTSATQAEKINKQKTEIMMLQMRPHFIYNTLTSIYYLCEQDPNMAQRAIGDFTVYLRKNLSAIGKDDLIPFTDEMEHTKAYLAVEKTRYENLLFVDYDFAHTDFKLPPLTLQPIVENAVKHGLDPELPALHISIKTFKNETGNVIRVTDTGPGFTEPENYSFDTDLATDQLKSPSDHIGISNVSRRLKSICNGTLEIKPGEDGGTIVTITIPR